MREYDMHDVKRFSCRLNLARPGSIVRCPLRAILLSSLLAIPPVQDAVHVFGAI